MASSNMNASQISKRRQRAWGHPRNVRLPSQTLSKKVRRKIIFQSDDDEIPISYSLTPETIHLRQNPGSRSKLASEKNNSRTANRECASIGSEIATKEVAYQTDDSMSSQEKYTCSIDNGSLMQLKTENGENDDDELVKQIRVEDSDRVHDELHDAGYDSDSGLGNSTKARNTTTDVALETETIQVKAYFGLKIWT